MRNPPHEDQESGKVDSSEGRYVLKEGLEGENRLFSEREREQNPSVKVSDRFAWGWTASRQRPPFTSLRAGSKRVRRRGYTVNSRDKLGARNPLLLKQGPTRIRLEAVEDSTIRNMMSQKGG